MAGTIEKKLADLGIELPKPAAPVANYVPFVRTGNFMVVSGQLCLDGAGKLVAKGQLGGAVSGSERVEHLADNGVRIEAGLRIHRRRRVLIDKDVGKDHAARLETRLVESAVFGTPPIA